MNTPAKAAPTPMEFPGSFATNFSKPSNINPAQIIRIGIRSMHPIIMIPFMLLQFIANLLLFNYILYRTYITVDYFYRPKTTDSPMLIKLKLDTRIPRSPWNQYLPDLLLLRFNIRIPFTIIIIKAVSMSAARIMSAAGYRLKPSSVASFPLSISISFQLYPVRQVRAIAAMLLTKPITGFL